MHWLRRIFSFKGRAGRLEFVVTSVVALVVTWLLCIVAIAALTIASVSGGDSASNPPTAAMQLIAVSVIAFLPSIIILAAAVRRVHDRGKMGLWALLFVLGPNIVFLIATTVSGQLHIGVLLWAVMMLWSFVELCCLPGAKGANPYGPAV